MAVQATCAHCGHPFLTSNPGHTRLCPLCRKQPLLRSLYRKPYVSKEQKEWEFAWEPPLPEAPTAADAGSPEKVAVLEARAARKESLHSPLDGIRLSGRRRKRRGNRYTARKESA